MEDWTGGNADGGDDRAKEISNLVDCPYRGAGCVLPVRSAGRRRLVAVEQRGSAARYGQRPSSRRRCLELEGGRPRRALAGAGRLDSPPPLAIRRRGGGFLSSTRFRRTGVASAVAIDAAATPWRRPRPRRQRRGLACGSPGTGGFFVIGIYIT